MVEHGMMYEPYSTPCDVCGQQHAYGVGLNTLSVEYRIEGVKELCNKCEDVINRYKDEMMDNALAGVRNNVHKKLREMKSRE